MRWLYVHTFTAFRFQRRYHLPRFGSRNATNIFNARSRLASAATAADDVWKWCKAGANDDDRAVCWLRAHIFAFERLSMVSMMSEVFPTNRTQRTRFGEIFSAFVCVKLVSPLLVVRSDKHINIGWLLSDAKWCTACRRSDGALNYSINEQKHLIYLHLNGFRQTFRTENTHSAIMCS